MPSKPSPFPLPRCLLPLPSISMAPLIGRVYIFYREIQSRKSTQSYHQSHHQSKKSNQSHHQSKSSIFFRVLNNSTSCYTLIFSSTYSGCQWASAVSGMASILFSVLLPESMIKIQSSSSHRNIFFDLFFDKKSVNIFDSSSSPLSNSMRRSFSNTLRRSQIVRLLWTISSRWAQQLSLSSSTKSLSHGLFSISLTLFSISYISSNFSSLLSLTMLKMVSWGSFLAQKLR